MLDLNFYWLVWFAVLLAVLALAVGIGSTLFQEMDEHPDLSMRGDGSWNSSL